ncbi:MAG: ATP-binding protein [Spirochaetia bacterium]
MPAWVCRTSVKGTRIREDSAKVFDEFYRARNEQTAGIPGTGLGLSLVKRLTELHEGTVSVSSELGKGSEFTVRFPSIP